MKSCPVWPFRLGKLPEQAPRSALKAIRGRCLDCVGESVKDVKECKTDCALNPYRFGKRINVSEAYREQARARLKNKPLSKKQRVTSRFRNQMQWDDLVVYAPKIDSGRVLPGVAGSCRSIPDPA